MWSGREGQTLAFGIFPELVQLVNRTPIDLSVQFDGQSTVLKPGVNTVPKVVVPYAKNQNPIMGSQDPNNPNVSGCRYLVGVVGTKDLCTPLTKDEWETHMARPLRMDEKALFGELLENDPKLRVIKRGQKKFNAYEAREVVHTDFGEGARDE